MAFSFYFVPHCTPLFFAYQSSAFVLSLSQDFFSYPPFAFCFWLCVWWDIAAVAATVCSPLGFHLGTMCLGVFLWKNWMGSELFSYYWQKCLCGDFFFFSIETEGYRRRIVRFQLALFGSTAVFLGEFTFLTRLLSVSPVACVAGEIKWAPYQSRIFSDSFPLKRNLGGRSLVLLLWTSCEEVENSWRMITLSHEIERTLLRCFSHLPMK